MKKIKKALAVFLAVLMLTAYAPIAQVDLFSISASAAEVANGTCGENLTWVLDDTGTLTISGTGAMTDYEFRETPWFSYIKDIKTVVIGDDITGIGSYAFYACDKLRSVTIPNGVTNIGGEAFYGCTSLTSITIPNSVTNVGAYAFARCSKLNSVSISNSMTSITGYMFYECTSLNSVTIPDSVTKIERFAFLNCNRIETVNYSGIKAQWNTVIIEADNEGLTEANIKCAAAEGYYGDYFWWSIDGEGTLKIEGFGELDECSDVSLTPWYEYKDYIKNVVFDYGIESIPANLVSGYAIESVTIADTVIKVADNAFSGCNSITKAEFIGTDEEWAAVTVGNGNDSLLNVIDSVVLAKGNCGDSATWWLNKYTGVLTISGSGYMDDYTAETDTPWYSVREQIKEVVVGEDIESVGEFAFSGCTSLQKVTINYRWIYIAYAAFENSTAISEVYYVGSYKDWQSDVSIIESTNESLINAAHFYTNEPQIDSTCIDEGTRKGVYCKNCKEYLTGGAVIPATGIHTGGEATCNATAVCSMCNQSYGDTNPDNHKAITNHDAQAPTLTSIGWDAYEDCSNCDYTTYNELPALEFIDGTCGENLTWVLDEGGTLTISGTGAMTDYVGGADVPWNDSTFADIKNVIIENGVTSIGVMAFNGCNTLNSVIIPDSVTEIGYYAFFGTGLTNVTIPDSVTEIGDYAFAESNITSIIIPDSVKTMEDGVFGHCEKLESAVIGNGVTSIMTAMFVNCLALESVTIPTKVKYIYEKAFYGCENLKTVNYSGSERMWNEITITEDNEPLTKATKTFALESNCGDNLTWIVDDEGTLTISGTGDMYNYSSENPAPWSIYKATIKTVVIEDTVTTIGDNAFTYHTALESIDMPYGVTKIGSYAFISCTSLKELIIPDSVTSLGYAAFYDCSSLKKVKLSKGLDIINGEVFGQCHSLESIEIPDSITAIKFGAFTSCVSLKSIKLSPNITSIGENAFMGCYSLETIIMFNKIKTIESYAFDACSEIKAVYYGGTQDKWNSINIGSANGYLTGAPIYYNYAEGTCGENVTYVLNTNTGVLTISGTGAMKNYNQYSNPPWYGRNDITSVVIEGGITTIGDYAFYRLTELKSVTVPEGVTTIGTNAFINCGSLETVYLPKSLETVESSAFSQCDSLATVYYAGSETSWANVAVSESNESLTNAAFDYALAEGACGDNLTWAFNKNTGVLTISGTGEMLEYLVGNTPWYSYRDAITRVVVEDGVTSISKDAFSYFKNLAEVSLGNDVTSLGESAFFGSTVLKSITIPKNVKTIGGDTFSKCSALDNIEVDAENPYYSVENGILFNKDKTVLVFCPKTKSGEVVIPDTVKEIGLEAFADCVNITNVTIPYGVTLIDAYAFSNCESLENIIIPDSVTEIDIGAFSESGLISLTIPDSVTTMGDQVFYYCEKLENAVLGNGVTIIRFCMFEACFALETVTIPKSVKYVEQAAFYSCTNLQTVYYGGTEEQWSSIVIDNYNDPIVNVPHVIIQKAEVPENCGVADIEAGEYCIKCAEYTSGGDEIPATGNHTGGEATCAAQAVCSVCNQSYGELNSDNHTAFATYAAKDPTLFAVGWYAYEECSDCGYTTYKEIPSLDSVGGECDDNLTWVLTKDGTLTISGTGAMTEYLFGSTPWYKYRDAITRVVVEDGVTSISRHAFSYFENLAEVSLGNDVTSLGESAFFGSTVLKSITIPKNVKIIRGDTFSKCSALDNIEVDAENPYYSVENGILFNKDKTVLVLCPKTKSGEVVIPDTVKEIGLEAFAYCVNITNVTIPYGVTHIDNDAFFNCESLENIIIPDSVTEIDIGAFSESGLTSITIPDSVTTLGDQVFYYCEKLENVVLGNGVNIIGFYMFDACFALETVTIPKSVKYVEQAAFYRCTNLQTVYYGGTEEQWNKITISNDNDPLTNATKEFALVEGACGDNLTWTLNKKTGVLTISGIGDMAKYSYRNAPWYAYSDAITDLIIEDGVTSISGEAFAYCKNISNVTIPNSVTKIGGYAFFYCQSLESITLPDSITEIGEYAFSESGLISLTIPDSVTTMGEGVFGLCKKLESVVFGNGISKINANMFNNCFVLETVTIPVSIKTIGSYAFDGYRDLQTVYYGGSEAQWNEISIDYNNDGIKNAAHVIIQKAEVLAACSVAGIEAGEYCIKCAEYTSGGAVIPATGNHTGGEATCAAHAVCQVCNNPYGDVNPDNHSALDTYEAKDPTPFAVGWYAYEECSDCGYTTYKEIPAVDSVSGNCGDNLTWTLTKDGTLTISGTGDMPVFKTASDAPWYEYKNDVKAVVVGDGITSISKFAFNEYKNLVTLDLADSIKKIEIYAFNKCENLNTFEMPKNLVQINSYAFYGCKLIESINLPDGLEYIDHFAFSGCRALENVVIPKSVTYLGINIFENCYYLKSINIPYGITAIPQGMLNRCMYLEELIIPETVTSIGVSLKDVYDVTVYYGGTEEQWSNVKIDTAENYDMDIPHVIIQKAEVLATCSVAGIEAGEYCIKCAEYTSGGAEIPATGNHTGGEATCSAQAVCEVCNNPYGEVNPDNHKNTEIRNAADATYEADGYTGDKYCLDCEALLEKGTAIPKLEKPTDPDQPTDPENPDDGDDDEITDCDHLCHSESKFVQFFWKIIRFLQKLFGIEQYCSCGRAHW